MIRGLRFFFGGLLLLASAVPASPADDKVDFGRDIRPLLSDKCYACHGPNASVREGGFRLDDQASAFGEADSGEHPIVPGDPGASEVIARITADDEFMKMPPPETNKTLGDAEIVLIRRWIEQGAAWQGHWAFIAPQRPELPQVQQADWPRTPIDYFVLARLEQEGLSPQAEADKTILLRRVTLDLTGLPPTPAEVKAFLADDSPEAYERVVDRLLASPHYGEHMARFWLDAARYGDTHGLHLDNYREMWPYRDWVVRAFNQNLSYDQFVIQQLAGDLLPAPTEDQLIATGFNRCHVTTNEGGSIAEEVYVRNVVDRVVTTSTVFMGLTFDCTRCHDHKYDPFTMKDFYSMFAFFNSMDGNPMDGNRKDPPPVLRVLTQEQREEIAALKKQIETAQAEIEAKLAAFEYVEPDSPASAAPPGPQEVVWVEDAVPQGAKAEGGWKFVDKPVLSGKRASTRTATGLSQHFFSGAKSPLRIAGGDILFAHVYLDPKNPPQEIMMQWNDGSWEHRAFWGENLIDWGKHESPSRLPMGELPEAGQWVRLEVPAVQVGLKPGSQINGWAFTQFGGTTYWDKAGITTTADQQPVYDSLLVWLRDMRAARGGTLPEDLKKLVMLPGDERTEDQQRRLRDFFIENVCAGSREVFDPLHQRVAEANQRIEAVNKAAATTLIFRERPTPKPAFVLNRGEYDQPKEEVQRATPASLPPMPGDAPKNRLGLAEWLVSPEHPLLARVTVNRFWQQLFGVGIVKTADDFGSQGEVPSHPELLDWLATEFMASGWNVKSLMKQMVLSAAYRQSSKVTPELLARDPENRLLARGPRFRLDAETLRDQALAVSGLLVDRLGGPSVKPPQPDGLWFAVGYSGSNTVRFQADKGPEKVHRRTLYTFIKRTSPPPQLSTFDAPSREACCVRRERTNTPLQSLLLMNDPQYVEAARGLAERTMREGGDSVAERAVRMFQLVACRPPDDAERAELIADYEDNLAIFTQDAEAAGKLIAVGESSPDASLDPSQLAAWTMVANLILNLDEIITKN